MNEWLIGVLATAGTLVVTLTVTHLYNYFLGLPKKYRERERQNREEKEMLMEENRRRDEQIASLQEAVDALPGYREQSFNIQADLRRTDQSILEMCQNINESVIENKREVLERLQHLENREKNALRAKLLEEYRLYTDDHKNPMGAWSEMEAHSFFELLRDYESLGGNDYMHSVVVPAMHELDVIPMRDIERLKELYDSRKI